MKDTQKEIDMALLEQLLSVIDKSAMESYKTPPQKMEPDKEENEEVVDEAGDESGFDDPIAKLRKLAKEKESAKGY
jgi:uncharacterized protein YdiU (UPF0061 family)